MELLVVVVMQNSFYNFALDHTGNEATMLHILEKTGQLAVIRKSGRLIFLGIVAIFVY